MKQHFILTLLFILFAAVIFSFGAPRHTLTGNWQIYNADGPSTGEYVEFTNDGTYRLHIQNGKIAGRGYYKLEHHVFSIRSGNDFYCGKGYWGKYKLKFHGNDSIHLTVIEDSCFHRRNDLVGFNPGLRRMKSE